MSEFYEAYQRVKGVLDTSIMDDLDKVQVSGGRLHSDDDRLSISTPVDSDLTFLVRGRHFASAVQRKHVDLSLDGSTLVVTSGNRVNELATASPRNFILPDGDWLEAGDWLKDSFKVLAPFMSTDRSRSWACGITVRDGKGYCTNNYAIGLWPGCPRELDVTFPVWCVDYINEMPHKLTHYIVEEKWIGLRFADGTEARSPRLSREFLKTAQEVGDKIEPVGNEISDKFRDVLMELIDVPDMDTIQISPDCCWVQRESGISKINIEAPTKKQSTWNPKLLKMCLEPATHMDFDAWPAPATWYGPDAYGMLAGKTK